MAREEKDLAEDVQNTNQKCGINIAAKFNWPTQLKEQDRKYSASSFCMDLLWAVREVCQSSPAAKDTVTQIKSLTCGFAAQRSLALKDGVIDYKIEWEAANNAYYALDYLKNNL